MTPRVPRRARGFTMTELLVVISIIVAMLSLAVPIFNLMSGSRSLDAGQNKISAVLQRARAQAIGLQDRRGVFFFNDKVTQQTAMLIVKLDDPDPTATSGAAVSALVIELDPDNPDLEFLPPGVGLAAIGPFPGFPTDYKTYPNALVAFDGLGRLLVTTYTTRATDSRYPAAGSNLKQQYLARIGTVIMDPSTGLGAQVPETSVASILLYDRNPYAALTPSSNPDKINSGTQEEWLRGQTNNSTQSASGGGMALIVNRYNGTLMRGE